MGLSCLWAVQQAYKDREKAEKQTAKMEQTMNLKEQREAAKERIKVCVLQFFLINCTII